VWVSLVRAPARYSAWNMASRAWLGVTPGPPGSAPLVTRWWHSAWGWAAGSRCSPNTAP
jgi:hypothetical protein